VHILGSPLNLQEQVIALNIPLLSLTIHLAIDTPLFPLVEMNTILISKIELLENQDAGLVIAAAIGTSVILWAIADAAAKLIKAARS